MKIHAIRKACMDMGTFRIVNVPYQGRQQWISNGLASWPVDGIEITEENISAVFDVPPSKRSSIEIATLYVPENFKQVYSSISIGNGSEHYAHPIDMRISAHGISVMPIAEEDSGAMYFIEPANLEPTGHKWHDFDFFVRHSNDSEVIVAYPDMFAAAIITPVSFKSKNLMQTIADMRMILAHSDREVLDDTNED